MLRNSIHARKHAVPSMLAFAVLVALMLVAPGLPAPALAQGADTFPDLSAGRRVYDATGASLTPDQTADLERRLNDLRATGADAVVYVRALDASPEETLRQVEALQQAWVAATGTDQDTAVAILINRNPDDPNDARAGIFAGSTFDDGNVPRDEQKAIVDDALIPPLRDGDVYGSLTAGIDRLRSSIVNGPPQGAFERWAGDAGTSWFPWAGVGTALAGLAAAFALFRNRQTIARPDAPPTTVRPGDLAPALAGALATGGPQASAVPATLLDLAARDAIDIEGESEGGMFGNPKVRVRLVDPGGVRDEVEAAAWTALERRAENGVVSSNDLTKVATDTKSVRAVLERQMREAGWLDAGAVRRKAGLVVICIVATGLAILCIAVAAAGRHWLPVVGTVALATVAVAAGVLYVRYSNLSRAGQEAAIPWRAYREGLRRAAKATAVPLDLDAVLPDTVAMNLGSAMEDRLKAADASGQVPRAFMSQARPNQTVGSWTAYGAIVATTGGSGSSTVSGGGAGGGGGAAGST